MRIDAERQTIGTDPLADITLTGLTPGYAVRLWDTDDVLQSTAAADGNGTATLESAGITGFYGYMIFYSDADCFVEAGRYPLYGEEDINGGDVYACGAIYERERLMFTDGVAGDMLLDLNDGESYNVLVFEPKMPSKVANTSQPPWENGEEPSEAYRDSNGSILFEILVRGTDQTDLDDKVSALVAEFTKRISWLEYCAIGRSESRWFKVYFATTFDPSSYFNVLQRQSGTEATLKFEMPCYPRKFGDWEQPDLFKIVNPNGSFEKRSGDDFAYYTKAITGGTITANTSQYFTGSVSCKLTTTATGDVVWISDTEPLVIDETHHHNLQLQAYKHSGTAALWITFYCFDEDGNELNNLSLEGAVDTENPTAWGDVVKRMWGTPVIYPTDSPLTPRWPEGTATAYMVVGTTGTICSVSIDALFLTDTDNIVEHEQNAAFGMKFEPGFFAGDSPAALDIYFSGPNFPATWGKQEGGITTDLFDVCAADASHVWACGAGGKIRFSDGGGSWPGLTSGVTNDLHGIDYLDATHLWSVGTDGKLLFSANGSTWAAQTYPAFAEMLNDGGLEQWTDSTHLTHWTADSYSEGWVVRTTDKYSGTYAANLRLFPGNQRSLTSESVTINAARTYTLAAALKQDSEWTTWDMLAYATVQVLFYHSSPGHPDTPLGGRNLMTRYKPGTSYALHTFTLSPSYPTGTTKIKLKVVGQSESAQTLGLYVDAFSMKEKARPSLYSVAAVASNNVYACGSTGHVVHYNGSLWAFQDTGSASTFRGVSAVDATHIWFVGTGGKIMFTNGTTWAAQTSGTTNDLHAVYAFDSTHVWAVGNNGTILFFNGTVWAKQTCPVSDYLHGVSGFKSGSDYHVWAVGYAGKAVYRAPATGVWSTDATGRIENLYGVKAISLTKAYAVGASGLILQGFNTVQTIPLTDLILGEREYHEDYAPVLDATSGTEVVNGYRRGSASQLLTPGVYNDFKFRLDAHKGNVLVCAGVTFAGSITHDQMSLISKLQTAAGVDLTLNTMEQDGLDYGNPQGKWLETALLATRFAAVDLPPYMVSENADLANLLAVLRLFPETISAAETAGIDYLAVVPRDAICEIHDWTYNAVILDSHSGIVLASLDGSLDSAMLYTSNNWHPSPRFTADPNGVCMCLVMIQDVAGDQRMTPRVNCYGRYLPEYELVP